MQGKGCYEVIKDNKYIRNNRLLLCFIVYTLTIFVYKDFGIPSFLGYLILSIIILYSIYKTKCYISHDKLSVGFVLFALVQIIEITAACISGRNTDIMMIPALFLCIVCVLFSCPKYDEVFKVSRIWNKIAIILALYVIIVALFPSFYNDFVYRFLSEESGTKAYLVLQQGYGVIVGANFEFIDYVLAFSVMFFVFSIAIKGVRNNKQTRNSIIMMILIMTAIIVENKKGELLCVIVSICLLLVSSAINKTRNRKTKIIIYLIGLGTIVIMGGTVLYLNGLLGRYGVFIDNIISNISGEKVDFTSGRIDLWRAAIDAFKSNPLFGVGWSGYEDYVPEYIKLSATYEIRHVHNCYLQLLCETGIVGCTFYLVPLLYTFFKSLKITVYLKKNAVVSEIHIISATCVGYQLFFLLEGLINPCWYKIVFLFLYASTIIIVNSCVRANEMMKRRFNNMELR